MTNREMDAYAPPKVGDRLILSGPTMPKGLRSGVHVEVTSSRDGGRTLGIKKIGVMKRIFRWLRWMI